MLAMSETITLTEEQLQKIVYACPECRSLQVEHEMWVSMNTDLTVSEGGSSDCFCQACSDAGYEGGFRGVLEIAAGETREGKKLAEMEAVLLAEDPAAMLQMEWHAEPLEKLRELIDEATKYRINQKQAEALLKACRVCQLDERVSAWLSENDPMLLRQINDAIAGASPKPQPATEPLTASESSP
jgi:hypothetical protein